MAKGVVERQIRNFKDVGRSMMETSGMPEVTNMFALYQAADVLNDLPTSANEGKLDCTAFPQAECTEAKSLTSRIGSLSVVFAQFILTTTTPTPTASNSRIVRVSMQGTPPRIIRARVMGLHQQAPSNCAISHY